MSVFTWIGLILFAIPTAMLLAGISDIGYPLMRAKYWGYVSIVGFFLLLVSILFKI